MIWIIVKVFVWIIKKSLDILFKVEVFGMIYVVEVFYFDVMIFKLLCIYIGVIKVMIICNRVVCLWNGFKGFFVVFNVEFYVLGLIIGKLWWVIKVSVV